MVDIEKLKALALAATPGPWYVGSKSTVGPRSEEDDQTFGMVLPLADIYGDQREANARLIAASPELLDALIAMSLAADNLDPQSGVPIGYQALLDALKLADSAIAKATEVPT